MCQAIHDRLLLGEAALFVPGYEECNSPVVPSDFSGCRLMVRPALLRDSLVLLLWCLSIPPSCGPVFFADGRRKQREDIETLQDRLRFLKVPTLVSFFILTHSIKQSPCLRTRQEHIPHVIESDLHKCDHDVMGPTLPSYQGLA